MVVEACSSGSAEVPREPESPCSEILRRKEPSPLLFFSSPSGMIVRALDCWSMEFRVCDDDGNDREGRKLLKVVDCV